MASSIVAMPAGASSDSHLAVNASGEATAAWLEFESNDVESASLRDGQWSTQLIAGPDQGFACGDAGLGWNEQEPTAEARMEVGSYRRAGSDWESPISGRWRRAF